LGVVLDGLDSCTAPVGVGASVGVLLALVAPGVCLVLVVGVLDGAVVVVAAGVLGGADRASVVGVGNGVAAGGCAKDCVLHALYGLGLVA
jgi:hypothetical protein